MLTDEELFGEERYEEWFGETILKSRLYKCVDRKNEFLWWDWAGSKKRVIDEEKIQKVLSFHPQHVVDKMIADFRNVPDFESGFYDNTISGTVLGLTENQRSRALKRKVKL